MPVLKCKMCGGDLNVTADEKITECEYCGSMQTIPEFGDEKKTNLFNRANRLRMDNEFDKAAGVYESIVSEFPEDSEGYWGLVLCSYGIEYVDDAKTGRKIPTCHRTLTSSVMDDDNFVQACENADVVARGVYREEAKAIDKLQQQIIAVVENEEPYDVFICYKETDDISKSRTEDSLIAQDIYTELIKEGYRVFFSRVTLRDKAGTEYEPYIYAALNSAKIMLAIGTKFDYYDAVWVKNEWSRYISMMAGDNSKHLIPCFKNLDAYDIPKEFKNLQALDMGEVTFFKNLIDNVERLIPKLTPTVGSSGEQAGLGNEQSFVKRAFIFLEDGLWNKADEYAEKVLDINPECGDGYLIKLLAENKIKSTDDVCNSNLRELGKSANYAKIVKYNTSQQTAKVVGFVERADEFETEKKYADAVAKLNSDYLWVSECKKICKMFREELSGYKDSEKMAQKCEDKIEQILEANRKYYKNRFKMPRSTFSLSLGSVTVLNKDGTIISDGDFDANACLNNVAIYSGDIVVKTDGTVETNSYFYSNYDLSRWKDIVDADGCLTHLVGLRKDGTVVAVGSNDYGECEVSDWTEVIKICAGQHSTIGLKKDGTVLLAGDFDMNFAINYDCVEDWFNYDDISMVFREGTVEFFKKDFRQCFMQWQNIVSISNGLYHVLGLKSDGTVVALKMNGFEDKGQCDVDAWENIVAIQTSHHSTVGLKSDGSIVVAGEHDFNPGDFTEIAMPLCGETAQEIFEKRVNEINDTIREKRGNFYDDNVELIIKNMQSCISAGYEFVVGLTTDGNLVADGDINWGACKASSWTDILSVSASFSCIFGLKENGTVVSSKRPNYPFTDCGQLEVSRWEDIVAISAGTYHTVGLKSDGTVVATGWTGDEKLYNGQCDVSHWNDIVAISAGDKHTVGLKANGTVVAVGSILAGVNNVREWRDIVSLSAGCNHIVGLKKDGTVVAVGGNASGECNVEQWKDIDSICAGPGYTAGLKKDGTVVATMYSTKYATSGHGLDYGQRDVLSMRDIVAICTSHKHTFGIKRDGTVVVTQLKGNNFNYTQPKVNKWKNIMTPIDAKSKEEYDMLRCEKRLKQLEVANERKQKKEANRIEQEERRQRAILKIEEQKQQYISLGLCQHCGGRFKGLFTKKCSKCGKNKDY